MKIAVVNTAHPFVYGGAEMHIDALVRALNEHGHETTLIRIPHAWDNVAAIERGMLASSLTRIPHVDRVIAHKFPSYYVQHDDKVVWLLHQLRQVYDLWQKPEGYGAQPEHLELRRRVRRLDVDSLGRARRYAHSPVSRERLLRYAGLDAAVLYHPLPDASGFRCENYGDYIFCPSRISTLKRQELLVRALGFTRTPVRLRLSGVAAVDGMVDSLHALAHGAGVSDRLVIDDRFITEEEKRQLYASALATAYVPLDEDSYGYVTLESAASSKAVITVTDSGGVLTAVRNDEGGLVSSATPKAVAASMDRLFDDRALAQRLGENLNAKIAAMNISWTHAVETLTA